MAAEVPESEVRTFANRNNMNLFRTSNVNENVRSNNTIDGASSIKELVLDRFYQFYITLQLSDICMAIGQLMSEIIGIVFDR